MDNESDNEFELLSEDSDEIDEILNPDEVRYRYEDDDKGIADDFVLFITESVADDLIEDIVGRLMNEKAAGIEQESESENYSHVASEDEVEEVKDEQEASESEKSLKDLTNYLNGFVADEFMNTPDKMTQITIKKIIDYLLTFVAENVISDIINTVVKNVSAIIVGRKIEQITEYLTSLITNKEILHAIVKTTGILMTRRFDCADGVEIGLPFEYLSREFIQKYNHTGKDEDLWEPLTDHLTNSIADSVIYDILDKLKDETTKHLTDYVFEYVFEDFLEEMSKELGESISKCSARTYMSDITVKNEDISDAKVKEDKKQADGREAEDELWKDFTDEQYEVGLVDATVNPRSLFSYVEVESDPRYVVNVPKRPALEELMKDMLDKNLGASFRIKIGDRLFDCIPRLLKVYSPWFANLDWRVEQCQFSSMDVPVSAFEWIYKWMRFQTPIDLSNVIKVMQAARHLKIDLLETDCFEMLSQPLVCEKLAFRLLVEADKMPMMDDIRDILLGRVRRCFLALVGSDEYINLKVNQVISLLSHNTIGVNSEAEVFFAALRWLGKSKQRLEHVADVMKCVRFEYLPMPMLFGIRSMGVSNETDETKATEGTERVMEEFQRIPQITKMLYDALTSISLQFQSTVDDEPIDPSTQIPPGSISPRRWVYHPKCPYHKSQLLYPYQHTFTQEDFDNYVASIQKDWLGDEPPENAVFDVEFDEFFEKFGNKNISSS